MPRSFLHFTHPNHPVTESYHSQEFICNACNTLGYGTSYRCSMCDFDLHKYCATCPNTIRFDLHPQHVLALVNHAYMGHFCDLCGKSVGGLFYRCHACDFDIHPLCTQVVSHVQHACHPQHLLKLQLAQRGWCTVCHEACTSWRYRCQGCNVDVHLECAFGPPEMSSWAPSTTFSAGYGRRVYPNRAIAQVGNQVQNERAAKERRRRRIYSVVGRIAVQALISSMLGGPTGSPS